MTERPPPIFIVGTGRCGSSLLHTLLSAHPDLAFLTALHDWFPTSFRLHRTAMRLVDVPVFSRTARRYLSPSEAWRFWDYRAPGFRAPCRDLRADDVTDLARRRLRKAFAEILGGRRRRLLCKLTGWSRLGYVREVFPATRFLHIIRDPRAVVSSLFRQPWFRGWQGPTQWRWGTLAPEEEQVWHEYDRSMVVLALIGWKRVVEAHYDSLRRLPPSVRDDVLDVHYGDFCASTEARVADILDHCHLTDVREFRRSFAAVRIASRDDKWQQDLNETQKRQLDEVIERFSLRRFFEP